MTGKDRRPPGRGRQDIVVWLQLLGLLAAVALFGWLMMKLAIKARHG